MNERLGVDDGETVHLRWELDADARRRARPSAGARSTLVRSSGSIGMPPAEPGIHSTAPPRRVRREHRLQGARRGNALYLPIPVDGALFSAGDGHARQGDGEVSQLAIECPARACAS